MKSRFYIVGIKHCGKSTVGKSLSDELDIPYYDLDDLIEESVGMSVRRLYKTQGRDAFQKEETLALKRLIESDELDFICATGGGICDNSEAVKILKPLTGKIFINTSFPVVYSRILKNGIPSFLKTDDPKKEFKEMYDRRSNLYSALNNIEISGDNKTPEEIKIEILNQIKEP